MIKALDLSFSFGSKKVLNKINFEAQLGQSIEISGDNGSGKTTFLKNLAGLLTPSHGQVLIDNLNTKTDFLKVKNIIAYVGVSDGGFFSRLTGLKNLSLLSEFYGLDESALKIKVDELGQYFDLGPILKTPFVEMSTGMKQLLRITLSLVSSHKVLLLDEPLRSLDKKNRTGLVKLLSEKPLDRLLVYSNHLDLEWQPLKPRTYHLANGRFL